MSLFGRSRRYVLSVHCFLIASATFTGIGLLLLTLRSLDESTAYIHHHHRFPVSLTTTAAGYGRQANINENETRRSEGCATVEEMGDVFRGGFLEESLRVRNIIQRHFEINGAARVRGLPPEEFCRQGFVIAKASEAGFGNEMYKILTAAALSIMLNRSLIIGQTRHIGVNIHLGSTYLTPMLLLP